jgi:hypothetical protein
MERKADILQWHNWDVLEMFWNLPSRPLIYRFHKFLKNLLSLIRAAGGLYDFRNFE